MGIGRQTDRQRQRVGEWGESERGGGGEGRGLELIGKLTIAHQLFGGCG